jgi:hypothetical protein
VERLNATTERALHAVDPGSFRGEEILRRALAALPGMAYRSGFDLERTLQFASLGCRTITGFEAGDLVNDRVVSYGRLIHPDDRARVLEAVQQAVKDGGPFELTYRIRRVDGRERRVREHGFVVRGATGEVEAIEGLIMGLEAGPQRDLEDDLRRLEQVATEVAHDVNNVLATIKTTAELAVLEARDPTLAADMAEIVSAATRGAALSQRLGRAASAIPAPPAD